MRCIEIKAGDLSQIINLDNVESVYILKDSFMLLMTSGDKIKFIVDDHGGKEILAEIRKFVSMTLSVKTVCVKDGKVDSDE